MFNLSMLASADLAYAGHSPMESSDLSTSDCACPAGSEDYSFSSIVAESIKVPSGSEEHRNSTSFIGLNLIRLPVGMKSLLKAANDSAYSSRMVSSMSAAYACNGPHWWKYL